jgi:hypothetical protein
MPSGEPIAGRVLNALAVVGLLHPLLFRMSGTGAKSQNEAGRSAIAESTRNGATRNERNL